MQKRICALITALLLLTGTLAGCGEEEKTAQVTLRSLSILGGADEKAAYTALLETYSAKHPEVYHFGTVAEESGAYKLNATFENTYTASRYPHIVYYYTDTGIDELRSLFVPVEEIRESYPEFASGISEAALDSVRSADGKVYCVPFAGNWTALAVNTKLFGRYSIDIPTTWQGLVMAAGLFSARGVLPFANSPDDSAALLELLSAAVGGEDAVDALPSSQAKADDPALLAMFEAYQELSGINAFPQAVVTSELAPYIGSRSSANGDTAANPVSLFNEGGAAMLVLDGSQMSNITLDGCKFIDFPSSGIMSGEGEYPFIGGFNTGWFITRRAFEDSTVRDAAVSFVDSMTGQAAAESFVSLGRLSSYILSEDPAGNGLSRLAAGAGAIITSRRTSVNLDRFEALERIAAALSCKIITVEQAARLAANPQLRLADVAAPPVNTTSDSDAAVSPSDAA